MAEKSPEIPGKPVYSCKFGAQIFPKIVKNFPVTPKFRRKLSKMVENDQKWPKMAPGNRFKR